MRVPSAVFRRAVSVAALCAVASVSGTTVSASAGPHPAAAGKGVSVSFPAAVRQLSFSNTPDDFAATLANGSGWVVEHGAAARVVPAGGIDSTTPLQWIPHSDWVLYGHDGRYDVRPTEARAAATALPACASYALGIQALSRAVAYWCDGRLNILAVPAGASAPAMARVKSYAVPAVPVVRNGFAVDPGRQFVAVSTSQGVVVYQLSDGALVSGTGVAESPTSLLAWSSPGDVLAAGTAGGVFFWRSEGANGGEAGWSPVGAGARQLSWLPAGGLLVLHVSGGGGAFDVEHVGFIDGYAATVAQGTRPGLLSLEVVAGGATLWSQAPRPHGGFGLTAERVSLIPPPRPHAGVQDLAGPAPGAVVTTLATAPSGGSASLPESIALGPAGRLYFADAFGTIYALRDRRWQTVCVFPASDTFNAFAVTPGALFGATGSGDVFACSGGRVRLILKAHMFVTAMAAAPDGDLYFTDGFGVLERATDGRVRTLAGHTAGLKGPPQAPVMRDGQGGAASFAGISGMCWDPKLGLVVADGGQAIRVVTAEGRVYTLVRTHSRSPAGGGWPLAESWQPAYQSVACDGQGDIFFTDGTAPLVRVWRYADRTVRTVAGSVRPRPAPASDYAASLAGAYRDGPAEDAGFIAPESLAVSADGRALFVEDQFTDPEMILDSSATIREVAVPAGGQYGVP